jgi:hypothetical protein
MFGKYLQTFRSSSVHILSGSWRKQVSVRPYIPEVRNIHIHRQENLTSHIKMSKVLCATYSLMRTVLAVRADCILGDRNK